MSNALPGRPRQMVQQRRSFAVVASRFNHQYVQGLVDSAKKEVATLAPGAMVTMYEVPGAFEIPLLVQEVAARGEVDAIMALGVIIQGETAHAGLVAQAVTDALMRLGLHYKLPIIHGVLLVGDANQAQARCFGTELNRGVEAARAAVRMSQVVGDLKSR